MLENVKEACLQAILDSDREGANAIVDQWVETQGYADVLKEILDPILTELGNLWTVQKDITFAQVYVSATIAEDIILKVLANTRFESKDQGVYKIIIGNIEDDFHSLGRRLVATFLTSSNFQVIDLGNDVTAEAFVDCAVKEDANLIMVSAMMYTTAKNIYKVRQEINGRGYEGKILLAVGGAIFNLRAGLWQEVGADGSSRNAVEASILARKLLNQLQEGGKIEQL